MNELHDKQTLAKRMLVQVLRLPDGVASRQVDALTEQQLEEVCQTSQLPLRVQREVLKAVMTVDCAPIASEPDQDPATPDPVPPQVEPLEQDAAPGQEEDQEPGEDPVELPDTDVVE